MTNVHLQDLRNDRRVLQPYTGYSIPIEHDIDMPVMLSRYPGQYFKWYRYIFITNVFFLNFQDTELMDKTLMIALFFVSIVGQLFIFCYFGQKLETKFQGLNYEVFHCCWYNTPISCQKSYQFLLLRCLRRNTITAYKFIPCNLAIFHGVRIIYILESFFLSAFQHYKIEDLD